MAKQRFLLLPAVALALGITAARADVHWVITGFPPGATIPAATGHSDGVYYIETFTNSCGGSPSTYQYGAPSFTTDSSGNKTMDTQDGSCAGNESCWHTTGAGTTGSLTVGGSVINWTSATSGGKSCVNDTAHGWTSETVTITGDYVARACGGNVVVNYSAPDSLFGGQTNVTVNIANTFYARFFIDGKTNTQSYGIDSSLGNIIDGGAIRVDLGNGGVGYSKGPPSRPLNFSVTAAATYHCADTVTVTIVATYADMPTPTPSPSATVLPSPSASPVSTPSPGPTPPPVGAPTPPATASPPNVSVTSSGGGTAGNVIINNPNDFYAPVKKALEDAGNGQGAQSDTSGGAFGDGTGTHDTGDYTNRGHWDDLQGDVDGIITDKSNTIDSVKTWLNNFISDINSISGHTFGSVTTITMNFDAIGQSPTDAQGHSNRGRIHLPDHIDLVPWGSLIDMLRTVLAWLLRFAFWVLTYKLFASQGVQAA